MLSLVVAGSGLILALIAVVWLRRVSRRLDGLKQQYWELRYEYTRLRSQVSRLDPTTPPDPDAASTAAPAVSFVPLSTMKKKDK